MAFSRLTGPVPAKPVVRRRLSADTSTAKPSAVFSTTVMQAPWMAMESPMATSDMSSSPAATSSLTPSSPSGDTWRMLPMAATIPVNMVCFLRLEREG